MAEYIDREKLIERLHNAEENYKADHDYEVDDDPFSDGILSAMFSVNQIVGTEPVADVVERDKINKAIEESYKKGLTDAWECARKIGNNSQLGLEGMGFDFSELGTYYNPSWWVVFNYDVFKALEILKRSIGE